MAMPDVPVKYANDMLGVAPVLLRHILSLHPNLQEFVRNMNSSTLLYVIAHVPYFEVYLARMDSQPLDSIFRMIPDVANYMGSIHYDFAKEIAAKVPWLAQYVVETTTVSTEPTDTTTTTFHFTTKDPDLYDPIVAHVH